MPRFHIQRSIIIDAFAAQVFDTVADFGTWTTWSPWLPIEPDAKVTVSDPPDKEGSQYHWEGELVGEGQMTHTELNRSGSITSDLSFIKPFKSHSQVAFDLAETSSGTEITWHMFGSLPFFLFFMKSSMETFIGMDYERGLRMLKELIETGTVASKLEVIGIESLPAMKVSGVSGSCHLHQIAGKMEAAFKECFSAIRGADAADGDVDLISLYHPTSDMKRQQFDFTSGVVDHSAACGARELDQLDLAAGKYLCVRHIGSYENLGNVWSGAYQYARYKKLKVAKRPSLERYGNSPKDTPPEELVTDVFLPLR